MHASDIRGKAVISVESGARLGRVEEVLLDPVTLAAAAFRVSLNGQQATIPLEQIHKVGADAIMVPDEDVAQWITPSSAAGGLLSLSDVRGRKVVNDAGSLLGAVREIEIEPGDGRMRHIEVHTGGMFGLGGETTIVPSSGLAGVGPDVIVVRSGATPP
jgi:sporulation protein YlmC with PRC-barrel domain